VPEDTYTVRQVAPGVHVITGTDDVHSYLVQGSVWALLIDTGAGRGDLRAQIDRMTALPLIVVNTHGHVEHTGGNAEFDTIGLHVADLERMERGGFEEDVPDAMASSTPAHSEHAQSRTAAVTHAVDHGEVLDLGGRYIEVLHPPGPTPGSICLLEEASRFLFTGDTIGAFTIPLQLEESDVEAYAQTAVLLEAMGWDVNLVLPGHGETPLDGGILLELGAAMRRLLDGEGLYQPREWRGRTVYEAWLGSFSLRLREPLGNPSRRKP
jgi:glyoxylase-like metal-dependent hydrolase (beta-lactamase superfamily II)